MFAHSVFTQVASYPIPAFPFIVAFTLCAGDQWIDMRITLAKEERESHTMLVKIMSMLTRDMNAVAGYFSSLSRK